MRRANFSRSTKQLILATKYITGYLMSRGDLADNRTIADLLAALERNAAPQSELGKKLLFLDSFQEVATLLPSTPTNSQHSSLLRPTHQEASRVEEFLNVLDVLALDADQHYTRIRTELEASGKPIGPNDLLIAAHAASLGLTLVSANTTAFSRIPDLPVENWLLNPWCNLPNC